MVKNTMKLVQNANEVINPIYDIYARNINDIRKESEDVSDMIINGFRFGYMQGMKATKSDIDMNDNVYDLEQAIMALEEIINSYEWDFEPDARKALEYSTTVKPKENCDKDAELSWLYLRGYKKIMWLVRVAKDYCWNIFEIYKGIEQ